jgi:prophage regulatory protein
MRMLRVPDVCKATTLSRTTIYRLVRAGKFPAPVKLTEQTIAWDQAAVDSWLQQKLSATLSAPSPIPAAHPDSPHTPASSRDAS